MGDEVERLPKPPIAADVDLRDFRFMPLDVINLENSETWALANGDQAKAMVNLWCRAWHQIPAGSLPDNDHILGVWSGVQNWADVREIALRGFNKCSDGKLYHSTICEKANEAVERKQNYVDAAKARWGKKKLTPKTQKQRIKKNTGNTSCVLEQGQGQGYIKDNPLTPEGNDSDNPGDKNLFEKTDGFDEFWGVYPRRIAKGQARTAYKSALKKIPHDSIIAAVVKYAVSIDGQESKFIKHPSTWLNGECWADEEQSGAEDDGGDVMRSVRTQTYLKALARGRTADWEEMWGYGAAPTMADWDPTWGPSPQSQPDMPDMPGFLQAGNRQ